MTPELALQPTLPQADALGRVLGHYRLLRLLGVGGMGQVFLAEHVVLGRFVAVKVLHKELTQQHDALTRFFNEARASAQLRHPGLIEVYDFGSDDSGAAYIVMELLEGSGLRELMDRHEVPISFAIGVIRQVAEAMALAHAHGIVHRDLKPENLFLVPDPLVPLGCRVKVLDFGIAKLFGPFLQNESVTRTGNILGTPAYMAPEQCHGAGRVDERADVYSLGCILFEMLCGRPPFVSDGVGALIASHLMEHPPAPSEVNPDVPPEVDDLVLAMLAKNADSRVGSMAELVVLIDALGVDKPPSHHPELVEWCRTLAVGSAPSRLPSPPAELGRPTPPRLAAPAGQPFALRPTTPANPPVWKIEPVEGTADQRRRPRRRRSSTMWTVAAVLGAAAAAVLLLRGPDLIRHAATPTPADVPAGLATATPMPAAAFEEPAPAPAPAVEVTPLAPAPVTLVTWRVETNPSGARIVRESDGAELGRTPLELRVAAGTGRQVLLVDKEGFRSTRAEMPLDRDASAIVQLAPQARVRAPARTRSRARAEETSAPRRDVDPVADGALDPYGD